MRNTGVGQHPKAGHFRPRGSSSIQMLLTRRHTKAEAWVKKHPDKAAAMWLGSTAKLPSPVWLVIWGTAKSGYAVYVDATTGIADPK